MKKNYLIQMSINLENRLDRNLKKELTRYFSFSGDNSDGKVKFAKILESAFRWENYEKGSLEKYFF